MMKPSRMTTIGQTFSIHHSSMTIFAILELVLIQQPKVDNHSQFFQQVHMQLWNIDNISRALRFKF